VRAYKYDVKKRRELTALIEDEMSQYCYFFMKEWGSFVCGTCMVLFWLFSVVAAFVLIRKLYPYFFKNNDQEDNPEGISQNLYENSEKYRLEFLEKRKDLEC
jgi:hypothetical protein